MVFCKSPLESLTAEDVRDLREPGHGIDAIFRPPQVDGLLYRTTGSVVLSAMRR